MFNKAQRIRNKISRKYAELDGAEASLHELQATKRMLRFSPHMEIGKLTEKISLLKREISQLEYKLHILRKKTDPNYSI